MAVFSRVTFSRYGEDYLFGLETCSCPYYGLAWSTMGGLGSILYTE